MRIEKGNMWRAALFLAVMAFWLWRTLSAGGTIYQALLALFGLAALTSLAGWLPLRYQHILVNISVSLVFLDLVFAQLDLQRLLTAVWGMRWMGLVVAVLWVVVHMVFRTIRWQWLLKPLADVPFWKAFRAACIGIGGNMVLPARAGEFLRAYVIGRSTGISMASAFATLVIERIFDGLTILLVLLLMILSGVWSQELRGVAIAGGLFYLLALGGVILFFFRKEWLSGLILKFVPGRLKPMVSKLLSSFGQGLDVLRNRRQLVMVIFWNILTWVVVPPSFYAVISAFNFEGAPPASSAILMLPLMALGLTVPGAPAGIGIVEYMSVLALQISFRSAGVPMGTGFAETAAAAALVVHASQSIPEAVMGGVAFLLEGLGRKDISLKLENMGAEE